MENETLTTKNGTNLEMQKSGIVENIAIPGPGKRERGRGRERDREEKEWTARNELYNDEFMAIIKNTL